MRFIDRKHIYQPGDLFLNHANSGQPIILILEAINIHPDQYLVLTSEYPKPVGRFISELYFRKLN